MKLLFFFLFIGNIALSQNIKPADKTLILSIMEKQENCWNTGDLECFMDGYWESDSLKFIGSKGLTYGWQKTLDNYIKSYPDKAAMGILKFDILSLENLSDNTILVIGKWYLSREIGNVGGHYSLIWKKINGKWNIIVDHSS